MKKKHFCIAVIAGVVSVSLIAAANNNSNTVCKGAINIPQQVAALSKAAPDLNTHVLKLALTAYDNAYKKGIKSDSELFTIVDYGMPDNQKRLWVLNLKTDQVVCNTWVAQGKNTGLVDATHFSNRPGSLETSLGLYKTGKSYYGNDGYSMHLIGLSPGFNNNAYSREIVMHGAWYVSPQFVKEHHRVGRSWGCMALPKKVVHKVINNIKGGSLIFAYGNDKTWLSHSEYLHTSMA